MKTEAKFEDGSSNGEEQFSGKDDFLEAVIETTDEVSQVEELRKHIEKMKEDLIRYFTDVLGKYQLELSIPADSLNLKGKDNVKSIFLNESGVLSYNLTDGTVKSQRLEDYEPAELMAILGSITPHLKEALKRKRKEYEKMSNRLTKIGKYLGFLKDKLTGKPNVPPRSSISDNEENEKVGE